MHKIYTGVLVVGWLATFNMPHVSFRPAGWLDRVVEYHKQRFFADVKKRLPPIGFSVKMMKAPDNYVDSKQWDYDSVVRLLTLMRAKEETRPIFNSLRRSLSSARRLYGMGKKESYNIFPNIDPNNYYESSNERVDEDELVEEKDVSDMDDDTVLYISNPAEAKLPVSRISVKALREILEARAEAARAMPTTTQNWNWEELFPKKDSTAADAGDGEGNSTDANGTADGNGTGGDSNGTAGAAEDTPTTTAAAPPA